ncbi:helix-turn-helix domain-containing protein [Flindersiella endophytica]
MSRAAVTKTVSYRWHVRWLMTEHDMHHTTDLVPLLADRGVVMTPTQVYRVITRAPERMNMQLLAALCDIFGCTPNDLVEPYVVATSTRRRKAASATGNTTGTANSGPRSGGSAASASSRKAGKQRPTRAVISGVEP